MGFTQKFLSSPACRRWLRQRPRLRGTHGVPFGVRSPPPAVWTLRGPLAPQQSGGSSGTPRAGVPGANTSGRVGSGHRDPAGAAPAAPLVQALGGKGVSSICEGLGACSLLGGLGPWGAAEPSCCHLAVLLGFAKFRRFCLQLWEEPWGWCHTQSTQPGIGSASAHLSSSKGTHSPAGSFFGSLTHLGGFAWLQLPSYVRVWGSSEWPCSPWCPQPGHPVAGQAGAALELVPSPPPPCRSCCLWGSQRGRLVGRGQKGSCAGTW